MSAPKVVNVAFPFQELASMLTPNDQFYVRSHFPVPAIDANARRLCVDGAVERPYSIGLEELMGLPRLQVVATLECAGNGRRFLNPPAKGVQWELGAASTAEWSGVPLRLLLEPAGVSSKALEAIFEGADAGTIGEDLAPPGPMQFAFSIPIERAMRHDTIVAFAMNGEVLAPLHGFPLRVVVPGYYAVASVKWLRRVVVTETPFRGYFQTIEYAAWRERNGLTVREPLREMNLKSQIAQPANGERLAHDSPYTVRGAAWTPDAEIGRVEVSWEGANWQEARLLGEPVPNAWRLWECDTRTPAQAGPYKLRSRAIDSLGRIQPDSHDPRNGGYAIHHVLASDVEIV